MTEILSCETCAYHKDHAKTWTIKAQTRTACWIECRRKPPTVVPDGQEQRSMWPTVEAGDWCGEWSATFK